MEKPGHLTKGIMGLKRHTIASMKHRMSAHAALHKYTSHIHAWLRDHQDLLHPINLAAALVSVAQLWQRAGTFEVTADELKAATAYKLADVFMTQPQQLQSNRSVCSVFWSLARLDALPRYEAALAEMFLATQHECSMIGISTALWGMSNRGINLLNGRMLEGIVSRLQVCLSRMNPTQETQVTDYESMFTNLTLHIDQQKFHFTRSCVTLQCMSLAHKCTTQPDWAGQPRRWCYRHATNKV